MAQDSLIPVPTPVDFAIQDVAEVTTTGIEGVTSTSPEDPGVVSDTGGFLEDIRQTTSDAENAGALPERSTDSSPSRIVDNQTNMGGFGDTAVVAGVAGLIALIIMGR